MKNLFNPADVSEMLERIEKLTPHAQRQWGKMNAAQMLAHCNKSLETAMGMNKIPRVFIGRIIGPLLKPRVLGEKIFARNSPTDKSYIFPDNLELEQEKSKTLASVKKFLDGGPSQCTTPPPPFFWRFTPQQIGKFYL